MAKDLIKALFIGIVQGVTEWLPISSTGHMILFDRYVGLDVSSEFKEFFFVVIQLFSTIAVIALYGKRLFPLFTKKSTEEKRQLFRLWEKILIACIPAALFGVLLDKWIFARLYNPKTVAIALIGYGIAFLFLDRYRKKKKPAVMSADGVSYREAALIGCFQILSLIPGTSRSGSTILGAALLGLSPGAAAEFSFFLAVPVTFGAACLKGTEFFLSQTAVAPGEWLLLAVGGTAALLTSLIAIRFLTDFVKRHGFTLFGIYRIILGVLVLIL